MKRDRQILQVAMELFHDRGFHAVGVDEIGARAGVTGPAIYRHFSSKNEILATLFDESWDQLIPATSQTFEDPQEELEHLVRAHAHHILTLGKLSSLWIREERSLVEPFKRRSRSRQRQYVERWVALLQRRYPERSDEELLTAAFTALGALNSVSYWPRTVLRGDTVEDTMTQMVLAGIRSLDHDPVVYDR